MTIEMRKSETGLGKIAVQFATVLSCFLALTAAAEAASTKVSDREPIVTEKLAKPGHVWVYDFAAKPEDVPADSALAGQDTDHSEPQTAEQIAEGDKLGAEIAQQLTKQIVDMGLPAAQATKSTRPEVNDLVIHGYILSISEGDAKKRIGIGFGKGASELKTAVEGFQMTEQGLRRLGGAKLDAEGSKAPGAALGVVGLVAMHNPVGLIVSTGMKVHSEKTGSAKVDGRATQTAKEIADELKKRFQEQGWIK